MAKPWLDIIGIGENGLDGLSVQAIETLRAAEIIMGGDRHHSLTPEIKARRISWPSPFDAMIDEIQSHRGKRLVILVTGDPLWYSVGARITQSIPANEIYFHPQLSAFQWATSRLGWSLADCDTLTIHGRADSQVVPFLAPHARLLILTQNSQSPSQVADILTDRGFGSSKMTVLAALGGAQEQRFEGIAENWDQSVPDFHTLAVECEAGDGAIWYPRTGGLPDDAYVHDGQITKQIVRASTIAALAPFPDAVLWDIGAGCGSISIEWMRASRNAQAYAIEPNENRLKLIADNARALGTEKIVTIAGKAPAAFIGLPMPDAIFIGGGLTGEGLFDPAWKALRSGGRLVVNTVTLESEAKLISLHRSYGGQLQRIGVQHAEPIGPFRGWRPNMSVTQWVVTKPAGIA